MNSTWSTAGDCRVHCWDRFKGWSQPSHALHATQLHARRSQPPGFIHQSTPRTTIPSKRISQSQYKRAYGSLRCSTWRHKGNTNTWEQCLISTACTEIDKAQLQLTTSIIRRQCHVIGTRFESQETNFVVARRTSTLNKVKYSAKFAQWTLLDYQKLDVPFNKLYRTMLKHLSSFPNERQNAMAYNSYHNKGTRCNCLSHSRSPSFRVAYYGATRTTCLYL